LCGAGRELGDAELGERWCGRIMRPHLVLTSGPFIRPLVNCPSARTATFLWCWKERTFESPCRHGRPNLGRFKCAADPRGNATSRDRAASVHCIARCAAMTLGLALGVRRVGCNITIQVHR
jgi:hypothetical protein